MKPILSIYQGSLRTEITHTQSGAVIQTDAPTDNHGLGQAFSPTDLVAAALGSCMLTVMGIYAQNEGISLEGTLVKTHKIMASNPRRISELELVFEFPASLHLTSSQKEKLERIARSCPVAHSIHPDLKQNITFSFADTLH